MSSPIENYFAKIKRYHYYFFVLVYSTKLPVFWHVLSLIFISPPMEYTCKGATEGVNQCPCAEPVWNRSVFTETLQTKYTLICDKKWMVSFTQSMLYVGTLIGALTFGILSDKYGRLTTFCASCFVITVAGILVVFMPSAATFIVMRTIEGWGVGGSIVTIYVFLVEFCGPSYREMVTALFHVPINISHCCLAGMSYLFRNCDHFQMVLSIPVILCCLLYWLTYESPKWLVDNQQYDRAFLVMQKIAKFNGDNPDTMKSEMQSFYSAYHRSQVVRISFWQIFHHRRLTINLCCMAYVYFTCGMGYYGVSQYIGKMSGDIHKNVAISGALLIPGTVASVFLLKSLGRRTFLMSTTFISGVLMIVVILIPKHMQSMRVLVACICNCFFFMSFIIVFLYGVELFPTTIRNSVLGFLSVVSRLGQIAAPPINAFPEEVSGAIFGAMAILGSVLCIPLPETKNRALPDTLAETENLSNKK
ncbi:unnamed protein product [Chrysodeixis includens]|uniref:Major facilitator superfamily (MFS) profile domain-containing protein n=1 Tax=Chrysodeixis includens TaxID=689277 RepID=A0A9P0G1L5_CHRIL|nr:unnamed protein product [Chrysodeixis includens]